MKISAAYKNPEGTILDIQVRGMVPGDIPECDYGESLDLIDVDITLPTVWGGVMRRWLEQGNTPAPFTPDPVKVAAEARKSVLNADATRADLLAKLRTMTPAQISTYVDNNTANLVEIRAVLKRILLVLAQ